MTSPLHKADPCKSDHLLKPLFDRKLYNSFFYLQMLAIEINKEILDTYHSDLEHRLWYETEWDKVLTLYLITFMTRVCLANLTQSYLPQWKMGMIRSNTQLYVYGCIDCQLFNYLRVIMTLKKLHHFSDDSFIWV